MKKLTLLTVIILAAYFTTAQIINIPDDFPTIQEGINAASVGDTVLVDAGIYIEQINFNGKNIIVASHYLTTLDTSYISQTNINGDNAWGSVVTFDCGEDSIALLCGFTITNGWAYKGGGLYCIDASPTLKNLVIKDNVARRGGGVFFENSTAHIYETDIIHNRAINNPDGSTQPDAFGGGVRCNDASPVFKDVNISNNVTIAPGGSAIGGGISTYSSSLVLKNVKIEKNVAVHRNRAVGYGSSGGGISAGESDIYLSNVTITENQAGYGGGISGGSGIEFDSINRCNIYLNKAIDGNDLYGGIPEVIVDTFTVLNPTSFHAYPPGSFSFDINSGYLKQEEADLFVSPQGNYTNSGLSANEPLLNTWCAFSKILVDSLHPHTIHLLEGTYSKGNNEELYPLKVQDYISLNGVSPNQVILDAEGNSNVIVLNEVNGITISNLTITGGSSIKGGGVKSNFSNALLQNLIVTGNSTTNYWNDAGGGIYCNNSLLELSDVSLTNNISRMGGGIYIQSSNPTIHNSTIDSNFAEYGGGVYCADSALPTFVGSTIRNNSASEMGGGLYNNQSQPVFDITNRSNIYLNKAIRGNDLYSDTLLNVIVDTFTVLNPTEFHAAPLQQFSFDILHGKIEQVNADLYVSPQGDNSNSGLTSDKPLKTIRYAMSAIIPDSLAQNTIRLLNGTYSTFENGEYFPINLTDHINLSGESQNGVILNAEEQSGVMIIQNNSSNHIEGLTISGGKALNGCGISINYSNPTIQNVSIINNNNDDPLGIKTGGGINCSYSNPILQNVIISNNSASRGGGIYCFYSNPVIENVIISDNSCSGYDRFGGGIYCFNSDILLQDVTISGNSSEDGGGIYCEESNPVIHNTNIVSNIANGYQENGGGGIYCIRSNPVLQNVNILNNTADANQSKGGGGICSILSNPSLTDVNFSGNHSVRGGAIYLDNSHPEIQDVIISGNSTRIGGGGIWCESSNPHLINVKIDSNYAKRTGGGMVCSTNSSPVLKQVTLSNNSTGDFNQNKGGGIYCDNSTPVLEDVLIFGNYGYSGGGIYCSSNSTFELKNVTIKKNIARDGGGIYCSSSNILFDDSNRSNIYLNNAVDGNELFSDVQMEIIVDTFTVLHPTNIHATPISNFTFNILHGLLEQVNKDLFVSPDGDNKSSGLSENDPVKNIRFALSKTLADSLNPQTIHLMSGTYSPVLNGDMFPLMLADYIKLIGESEDSVVLDAEGKSGVILLENISGCCLQGMTITGGVADRGGNGGGISCLYSNPIIRNVTISHDTAVHYVFEDGLGGGLYCFHSNPELFAVTFSANSAYRGGGIYCDVSDPYFENIVITDNSASITGGGISCYSNSNPVFVNVEISGNEAGKGGGGIAFSGYDCKHSLINVTLVNNVAGEYGGGLYTSPTSSTSVLNSILWNNTPDEIYGDSITISYCDIRGGWEGEGNIDIDPLFIETGDFPFALSDDSPCVNAGDPDTIGLSLPELDLSGNPRIWNDRIDMGAYEWNSLDIDDYEMGKPGTNICSYPNPFSTSTTIEFELKQAKKAEIKIYNQLGEMVEVILKNTQPGKQTFTWDAKDLPSGVYFIRLQIGNELITRKMIKL